MSVQHNKHLSFVAMLLSLVSFGLQGQETSPATGDPIIGVWELIPEASHYTNRDAPKSEIRTYEPHPEGISVTVNMDFGSGNKQQASYTGASDGVATPVQGLESADEVIVEKYNLRESEVIFTHAGRTVGTARRIISMDGTEMTVTVEIRGNVSSRALYRRIE